MTNNKISNKFFFTPRAKYIRLVLISIIVLLTACSQQQDPQDEQSNIKALVGENTAVLESKSGQASDAFEFSYPDLEGKTVKLSDYRGKWVVVNFWATWCPPCRKEIPDFVKFKKEFGEKIEILGINNEDAGNSKIEDFVFEYEINYPILRADVYQPSDFSSENTRGLPTTIIFNPQGVEVSKRVGPMHYSDLVKAIDL